MALLSDRHTCVTFDRRQMSNSQVEVNKTMSYPQQARDVAAVIRATGNTSSIIFGSSLGGIIAFQFAIDHPEMVVDLIAHEAPTFNLLSDASQLLDTFIALYEQYKLEGLDAIMPTFSKGFIGLDDESVPPTAAPDPRNPKNQWENEMLPAFYYPDLRKLVNNKISVGVMVGARSKDAWYARATIEQQKVMGCLHSVVPGHHQGFESEPDAFLPAMLEMMSKLRERRSTD